MTFDPSESHDTTHKGTLPPPDSQVVHTCNPFAGVTFRGLDNAGKTTVLKKFNGEDVHTISPTLGFNIKTLEHKG